MGSPVPQYIQRIGVIGASVAHPWDGELHLRLHHAKDQDDRLYRAIDAIAYRAKMALGVAIAEWLLCRFEGQADLTDGFQRLAAARASVIHLAYAKPLKVKSPLPLVSGEPAVNGPVHLTCTLLGELKAWYATGDIYLPETVVRIAMLAKHVLPAGAHRAFDDWLAAGIRRAGTTYPPQPPYDKTAKKYDPAGEDPVPLELFDPAWTYTPETAKDALRAFLATLDPKRNPYLNSPDDLKAKGFSGTPYQL